MPDLMGVESKNTKLAAQNAILLFTFLHFKKILIESFLSDFCTNPIYLKPFQDVFESF